jgi:carbon starvation protein
MIEGFVLDTLDVSIRLNRYLLEEVWSLAFGGPARVPRLLRSYWTNSGIAVGAMLLLAYRNTADVLWPIFGTGNQLLAALSLLAISVWLYKARARVAFTLLPMAFVLVITLWSLLSLSIGSLGSAQGIDVPAMNGLAALVLVGLALFLTGSALWKLRSPSR